MYGFVLLWGLNKPRTDQSSSPVVFPLPNQPSFLHFSSQHWCSHLPPSSLLLESVLFFRIFSLPGTSLPGFWELCQLFLQRTTSLLFPLLSSSFHLLKPLVSHPSKLRVLWQSPLPPTSPSAIRLHSVAGRSSWNTATAQPLLCLGISVASLPSNVWMRTIMMVMVAKASTVYRALIMCQVWDKHFIHILSWPNSLFGFFRKVLQKNPYELFGQPNIITTSYNTCTIISTIQVRKLRTSVFKWFAQDFTSKTRQWSKSIPMLYVLRHAGFPVLF